MRERKSGGKSARWAVVIGTVCAGTALADVEWAALPVTLHSTLQSVDGSGLGTFPVSTSGPIKLRGILLNNPEDMLNRAAGAPGFLGGQWQVFLQAVEPGDFGGTAIFAGQLGGKVGGTSYTDAAWNAEVDRFSHDADTGHLFRAGDLVEVRARAPGLFFNGKTNINEQHSTAPELDWDIHLITPGVGLPVPAAITLADLKDPGNEFRFRQDRLSGPEHYQGSLVRLAGVSLLDGSAWGPGGTIQVQDDAGRSLNIQLGLDAGFSAYAPPVGVGGKFDVVGIFNQEDGAGGDGWKSGYSIWVMNYDGNAAVLPEPASLNVLLLGGIFAARRRNR